MKACYDYMPEPRISEVDFLNFLLPSYYTPVKETDSGFCTEFSIVVFSPPVFLVPSSK